jgi:septum formation protein
MPLKLKYPLVLASNSPRRKEILSNVGVPFTVQTQDTDESFSESMPAHEVAAYLATKKNTAFENLPENTLLLTADTIVVVDETILNKPANKTEATAMLQSLSNKTHIVYTGVCLRINEQIVSKTDRTDVYFNTLSNWEIEHYINTAKPFDKAGSYGVQDFLGMVAIPKIEGSFYNVMGLPIHVIYELLKEYIIE